MKKFLLIVTLMVLLLPASYLRSGDGDNPKIDFSNLLYVLLLMGNLLKNRIWTSKEQTAFFLFYSLVAKPNLFTRFAKDGEISKESLEELFKEKYDEILRLMENELYNFSSDTHIDKALNIAYGVAEPIIVKKYGELEPDDLNQLTGKKSQLMKMKQGKIDVNKRSFVKNRWSSGCSLFLV